MNLSIIGKQFVLTEPIKEYIENAINSLTKYNLDIISVRAVVSADEKNGKKGLGAEFSINLAKKDTIVIKQKDKDLYAAIDLAIERAKKVLRRHHDKLTSLKAKAKDNTTQEVTVDIEKIEGVDEIVPMALETYKPQEIEEAMQKLKDSAMQFYVFMDMDDKLRVMYKRSDEKFGMY